MVEPWLGESSCEGISLNSGVSVRNRLFSVTTTVAYPRVTWRATGELILGGYSERDTLTLEAAALDARSRSRSTSTSTISKDLRDYCRETVNYNHGRRATQSQHLLPPRYILPGSAEAPTKIPDSFV